MRLRGFCLTAVVLGSSGVAAANEVTVRLVGESGPLGPPAYVVTVDGVLVGAGVLRAPEGAAPRELPELLPVATELTFPIPDGLLQPSSVVSIHLINDSIDAATNEDTTLYILGVAVDGASVDVGAAAVRTPKGEVMPIYMGADGALILAWNAAASFAAPAGGWLAVGAEAVTPTTEASSEPAEPATEETTAEAAPTEEEAPAVEEAPAAVDAPVADEPAAPVADTAAPVEDTAVAETPAAPEVAEPSCAADATIVLTDFANGESYVTEKTAQELIGFLKDVSADQCKLAVTGYSSPGGEPEINLAVSQARADAVLEFIKTRNLPFAAAESVGRGETTEFGDAGANRRVVVTVGP